MLSIEDVRKNCVDLRSSHALRDSANKEYERMFLLNDPGDLPTEKWVKKTLSPDARNALIGAVRLLTATDPKWSVPEDLNNTLAGGSSTIEKLAGAIWSSAGRVQGKPRHYDVVLSGLLYGEVIIAPVCTADLYEASDGGTKKRYEQIMKQTPLIFDVIPPSQAYPVYDGIGLASYHAYRSMLARDILQRYPNARLGDVKGSERFNVAEYWDYDVHYVWIEGGETLVEAENDWGFIPIAAGITEGSMLFTESNQLTRQPFLYTLWKSSMWERQNLSLTMIYSLIFSMGANPMFLWRRNDPTKDAPERDYTTPGGIIAIDQGEDYTPLAKQVIDPSIMQGLQIANDKGVESTIYRQALGEPLGSSAPYSMVALLSQAGRLPLIPYQRMCSHVIGEAMAKGLMMIKQHGGSFEIRDDKQLIDVNVEDLPDTIEIEANLDIDMPQDIAQNAQTAIALTSGDNPLMSVETAQKRFLQIEQPDEERKKVWYERAASMNFMQYIQSQMQLAQLELQRMIQAMSQPPQGMPQGMYQGIPPEGAPMPEGMPPEGAPEEIPPENVPEELIRRSAGGRRGVPAQPLTQPLPPRGSVPPEEELL